MKTGRRDSKESYADVVQEFIPLHNDTIDVVLSRFQSIGIDVGGTVALLGLSLSLEYSIPKSRVLDSLIRVRVAYQQSNPWFSSLRVCQMH